jgi:hypothetical protein
MGLRASAIRSCAHRRSSSVKIAGDTRSPLFFFIHTHTYIYIRACVRGISVDRYRQDLTGIDRQDGV